MPSSEIEARIRALPKVELHQHVDGSIPAEVTWELMRHYRLHPVDSLDEMRRRLELQPEEEGTLLAYLDKMHYPLWITQFYENITRVTEAIVDAAAVAGVETLELRYSPTIHTFAGLTPRQSIRAVLSGMNHASEAPPQDEARGSSSSPCASTAPHREDPGPAGHRRGPAPPRAHGRRRLRHRGARARQPAAPVQERLRDRAPGPPRPHRARRRGRARRVRLGGGGRLGRSASATAARPPPTRS